jgi:hypothetical protein
MAEDPVNVLCQSMGTIWEVPMSRKTKVDTSVCENAFFSICDKLDPDSNRSEDNDLKSEKHFSPKTSTDAGTIVSIKPVQENAHFSIRDNLDPDPNVTEESDLQEEKRHSPKTSTDAGTITSTKPVSLNARLSIRDSIFEGRSPVNKED